jgi:benzaldehyde dehydrogenase (NAD)
VEGNIMGFLNESAWTGKIYSDGWVAASGGDAPVVEPATGREIGRSGVADRSDLERAAERAAAAQADWASTAFDQRAAILRRAGELINEHAGELHEWIMSETGGTPPKAAFETHVAAGECIAAAELTSRPLGQVLPTPQPQLSIARRLPVGVVGVISPFNFPLILSSRSVAPALALGNAVLLKPDPRTAVTGGILLARVFEEAGLPPGLLHVLPGGADIGQALIEDRHVRLISFTGSTAAGRQVGEAAARNFKRVLLEMGGNNALVVFDDADLELAASAGAYGSFLHQGQICMTTGRHVVHERLKDDYVELLAKKADAMPVGNPLTEQVALGPVIDEGQRDKIHRLVTDSLDAGATLAAGGRFEGLFYRPTVLDNVSRQTPAYTDEIFGPVAPVVSFSSDDEAIALASDTAYGLSLGIITRDVMKGVDLAGRIPAGIVHINDQTVADEPIVPFGGVRTSGNGTRLGGDANIEAFTETQWLTIRGDVPAYPF